MQIGGGGGGGTRRAGSVRDRGAKWSLPGRVSAMPVDRVNGVGLYWERRGSGHRLLFFNGSGLTLQAVRPLLDPLAASFDLLASGLPRLWPQRPGDSPVHHGRYRGRRRGAAGGHRVAVVPGGRGELWRHGGAGVRRHPSAAGRAPGSGLHIGRWRGGSSYPLQKLAEFPPGQRAAVELKVADSRWDQHWLEAHPVDRAIAERMTAAGHDRRTRPQRRPRGPAPGARRPRRVGPARRDHLPGPGWLRQLRRDRTGSQQRKDRIAHPRRRAAWLRRRPRVLVPRPGRPPGIYRIPAGTTGLTGKRNATDFRCFRLSVFFVILVFRVCFEVRFLVMRGVCDDVSLAAAMHR